MALKKRPPQRKKPDEAKRPQHNLGVPFAIVGVGASAGGLEAYTALLAGLPADTGMAFVFVPHLAPSHASMLPEILQRATQMPVSEVKDEPTVAANHVYVIPPGRTMTIRAGKLRLAQRPEGQHHPVDQFLISLAEYQGHRLIGVILSGTATDGTIGLRAIKAAGGTTFAQDDTAQHDGMPQSAVASGSVDFVLPPARIAKEILRIARHPYVAEEYVATSEAIGNIDEILALMREKSGVDFTQYKSNTLQRRIRRRMMLLKLTSTQEYAQHLRAQAAEIEALYRDILIGVTNFFRNPEVFEALKAKVFPHLFAERARKDPVRVWVLGCATGEEPFSLAIALTEYAAAV